MTEEFRFGLFIIVVYIIGGGILIYALIGPFDKRSKK